MTCNNLRTAQRHSHKAKTKMLSMKPHLLTYLHVAYVSIYTRVYIQPPVRTADMLCHILCQYTMHTTIVILKLADMKENNDI